MLRSSTNQVPLWRLARVELGFRRVMTNRWSPFWAKDGFDKEKLLLAAIDFFNFRVD